MVLQLSSAQLNSFEFSKPAPVPESLEAFQPSYNSQPITLNQTKSVVLNEVVVTYFREIISISMVVKSVLWKWTINQSRWRRVRNISLI